MGLFDGLEASLISARNGFNQVRDTANRVVPVVRDTVEDAQQLFNTIRIGIDDTAQTVRDRFGQQVYIPRQQAPLPTPVFGPVVSNNTPPPMSGLETRGSEVLGLAVVGVGIIVLIMMTR